MLISYMETCISFSTNHRNIHVVHVSFIKETTNISEMKTVCNYFQLPCFETIFYQCPKTLSFLKDMSMAPDKILFS